jgi:hypothetical protein
MKKTASIYILFFLPDGNPIHRKGKEYNEGVPMFKNKKS